MINFEEYPICPKCGYTYCDWTHYNATVLGSGEDAQYIEIRCRRCGASFEMKCKDNKEDWND